MAEPEDDESRRDFRRIEATKTQARIAELEQLSGELQTELARLTSQLLAAQQNAAAKVSIPARMRNPSVVVDEVDDDAAASNEDGFFPPPDGPLRCRRTAESPPSRTVVSPTTAAARRELTSGYFAKTPSSVTAPPRDENVCLTVCTCTLMVFVIFLCWQLLLTSRWIFNPPLPPTRGGGFL